MEIATMKCSAMGCTMAVSSDFVMCRRHWRMVDRSLQEQIWEAHHAGDRAQHLTLVSLAAEEVRSREIELGRRCRSCDAPIFFAISTKSSRPIPIDALPVANGNMLVRQGLKSPKLYAKIVAKSENPEEERYVSHYATCPQADEWRATKRQ